MDRTRRPFGIIIVVFYLLALLFLSLGWFARGYIEVLTYRIPGIASILAYVVWAAVIIYLALRLPKQSRVAWKLAIAFFAYVAIHALIETTTKVTLNPSLQQAATTKALASLFAAILAIGYLMSVRPYYRSQTMIEQYSLVGIMIVAMVFSVAATLALNFMPVSDTSLEQSGLIGLCNDEPLMAQRDLCFFNAATKTLDISACHLIGSSDMRTSCVSSTYKLIYDAGLCDDRQGADRDYCYIYAALFSLQEDICVHVDAEDSRNACIANIAQLSGDPRPCSRSSDPYRDICYQGARANLTLAYCSSIQDQDAKLVCLSMVR